MFEWIIKTRRKTKRLDDSVRHCGIYLTRILTRLGYPCYVVGSYFDKNMVIFKMRLSKDLDAVYPALESNWEFICDELGVEKIGTRKFAGNFEIRFPRKILNTLS